MISLMFVSKFLLNHPQIKLMQTLLSIENELGRKEQIEIGVLIELLMFYYLMIKLSFRKH